MFSARSIFGTFPKNERQCYITGTAYDNLIVNDSETNGGFMTEENKRAWPTYDPKKMVNCSFEKVSQEKLYSDPAVRLTINEVNSMNIVGSSITDGHSGRVAGEITNSWVDGRKLKIRALITDGKVVDDVRSNRYSGLSVGYFFDVSDGRVVNKTFDHVAVCKIPVFPTCRFAVTASKDGTSQIEGSTNGGGSFSLFSETSGTEIESITYENEKPSEVPTKKQINNSHGYKIDSGTSSNDKHSGRTSARMDQNPQPPLPVEPPPPTSQRYEPQQNRDQRIATNETFGQNQTPSSSHQREEKHDETNRLSKKNEAKEEDGVDLEAIAQKNLRKLAKVKMMKKELERLQKAEEERKKEKAKEIEPQRKGFLNFVKKFSNSEEIDSTVTEVIENSFTTEGYEQWAGLLNKMRERTEELENAVNREAEEKKRLENEYSTLKRKREKEAAIFKMMRGDGGKKIKVPVDRDDDERFEEKREKSGIFKKPSAGAGLSSASKSATPQVENIFRKNKQNGANAPSTIKTGGKKPSGEGVKWEKYGVTASFDDESSRFNRELMEELRNNYNDVDPSADAFYFLSKSAASAPYVARYY